MVHSRTEALKKRPISSPPFRFSISRSWSGFAFCLLAITLNGCQKQAPVNPLLLPPEVEVTPVVQGDIPIIREWIGSIDGSTNAEIRARVQGYIISQNYTDGSLLKKGDLLFKIDPRPFIAAQAQARASLAQAQANQVKAQLNADKYVSLYKEKAVSEQDRDNAVQQNEAAKANIKAEQAALEQADLNVLYTDVTAPLDGIASIATKNIGDLVGPSDTSALATMSTVNPVRAYFQISEQSYLKIADKMPAIKADVKDGTKPAPVIEIILADGTLYPEKGKFVAMDLQVDDSTATIRLAAEFPNPGNILRPGQFVRVRVRVATETGALVVPQQAVQELQGSYQVAVVDENNKASIRVVKTGPRYGSMWVITEGLKLGEKVVAEGIQKVGNGREVVPKPYAPPQAAPAEAAPAPAPAAAQAATDLKPKP